MGQRRQSRELALQVLFSQEFAPSLDYRDGLELFKNNFDAEPDTFAYAIELLKGVTEQKTAIDALIQGQSAHWKMSRMSLVDVILMRIAVFELKFGDDSVPPPVVLNEAIEISKKYSTSDSAAFVNGILDQIMK